ncbi:MAG TPA: cation:proton antiporter [Candidatus Obscuribacterales bacterium]
MLRRRTTARVMSAVCAFGAALAFWWAGAAACLAAAPEYAEVRVGSAPAIVVAGMSSISADERAEIVNRRIDRILASPELNPADIRVAVLRDGTPAVVLGELVIVGAVREDAMAYRTDQAMLAHQWSETLRTKIGQLKPLYARAQKVDIKTLSEQHVLLLLLQVGILLTTAFFLGEVMVRIGQPPVVGQLLAGVLLGQSVLGALFPDVSGLVFPTEKTQSYLLEVVSWVGLLFLLMLTGTETNVALIRQQGKAAVWPAILGSVIPFCIGVGVGYLLPGNLLLNAQDRAVTAFFLGTLFAVSSVPVIAKILMDVKAIRRRIGQIVLTAALVQDTIGCVLLALVAAVASGDAGHSTSLWKAPLGTIAFFAVMFGARRLLFNLVRWAHDRLMTQGALLTLAVALLLFSAATTQFLGVHAVLGAFAIGVLLGQTPLIGERVMNPLHVVTMSIFAPVFFAAAGLHVNLTVLANGRLLMISAAFTGAVCLSKILSGYIGGRIGGLNTWESLSVGIGTNTYGAMGLIFAILGFSLGILSVDMYSMIIVMAMLTTCMAPPLLSWSLSHVPLSAEERLQLEREDQHGPTFVGRLNRILVVTRKDVDRRLAMDFLSSIGHHHSIEATILELAHQEQTADADMPGRGAGEGNVTMVRRTAECAELAPAVLKELARPYDLAIIGGSRNDGPAGFDPAVEGIIRNSPCPLLLLREGRQPELGAAGRILVPTTHGVHDVQATELAILLAQASNSQLVVVYVAEEHVNDLTWLQTSQQERMELAQDIVESIMALAEKSRVPIETVVRRGVHAGREIVKVAQEKECTLIILRGYLRPTRSLFFGHTISEVLSNAPSAVAVLAV